MSRFTPDVRRATLAVVALLSFFSPAFADPPTSTSTPESLAARIDQQLELPLRGIDVPVCDDATYIRRVYLDLVGKIPSADQTRSFLQDPDQAKRSRLVDFLLQSPEFASHMATALDVMWMERRPSKYVKQGQWRAFLTDALKANRPLNQIASDILSADGVDPDGRGPAAFYLEREVEPNLLTREVGRMFFGMDVQCAQCHDHPIIDDYDQADYYGLFAFVGRTYLFQPDKKKPAVLAEKPVGDASYKSVFTNQEGQTRPRLPGGREIDEPVIPEEKAYLVAPDPKKKELRPVPRYSRFSELAKRACDGSNDAFNRNLANRLWAHMFGRGLVHPVDQHHSDNPPVNPELLNLLATELVRTRFDLKQMLKQIAISNTYQRAFTPPDNLGVNAAVFQTQVDHWSDRKAKTEQTLQSLQEQRDQAAEELAELDERLPALAKAKDVAAAALTQSQTAFEKAQATSSQASELFRQAQAAIQRLEQSHRQTKEAAELLPDDQGIAELVATLTAHLERITERSKQLAESETTARKNADSATSELAQSKHKAEAATNAWSSNRKRTDELRATLPRLARQQREQETLLNHASQQAMRFQTLTEFANQLRERSNLQTQRESTAKLLAASEIEIGELQSKLQGLQQQLKAQQTTLANQSTRAKQLSQKLDITRRAVQLVSESREHAEQAFELLQTTKNGDNNLPTIVASLETKRDDLSGNADALTSELGVAKTSVAEAEKQVQRMREQLLSLEMQFAAAKKEQADLVSKQDTDRKRFEELDQTILSREQVVSEVLAKEFAIAVMQPLSPEQLAHSMLHATGHDSVLRARAEAAVDKKTPLKPEEKQDHKKLQSRLEQINTQTQAGIDRVVKQFVDLFAAAGGQPQDDFFATVDQALYFRNSGEVRGWLTPTNDNLIARTVAIEDANAVAEQLYLSILTRMPTSEEAAQVKGFLDDASVDRTKAIEELAWALLTSNEFRFHH